MVYREQEDVIDSCRDHQLHSIWTGFTDRQQIPASTQQSVSHAHIAQWNSRCYKMTELYWWTKRPSDSL